MKRLALVLAALILITACTKPESNAKLRLTDAYISCQQIAKEFADIKKLRSNAPDRTVAKKGERLKFRMTRKHLVRVAKKTARLPYAAVQKVPNGIKNGVTRYSGLRAAKHREPVLYKLSRIKDCNFRVQ